MKDIVPGFNFKKSNIRIWIHKRNLTNLQQVVWEGHGGKLLVEHSNNPRVKKFLEAVPHLMGLIKEIHVDTQNNDLESLKSKMVNVPPIVLSGKDTNGLSALHKAAGLGKQDMAAYIIEKYPTCINSIDNEGRTPLHYASLLKDGGNMTNFLIDHGADESALDNKQKTAGYYKNRPSELDAKQLLNVIPDCPRAAKEASAMNWDWGMLTATTPSEETPKIEKKIENIFGHAAPIDLETKEELKNPNEPTQPPEEDNTSDDKTEENILNNEENGKNGSTETGANGRAKSAANGKKDIEESEPNPTENEMDNEANNNDEDAEDQEINNEKSNDDNPATPPVEETKDTTTEEPTESRPESTKSQEPRTNGDGQVSRPQSHSRPSSTVPISEITSELKSRPSSVMHESQEADVQSSRPQSNSSQKSRPRTRKTRKIEIINNAENDNDPDDETKEADIQNVEVESEGFIEGVVNGENEIEVLNQEGQGSDDNDQDIGTLVETGNMEQLANVVLNGDGNKLLGIGSDNSEIQSFLENVPVYMEKINRIHVAAKEGTLKDLQAALDRRKFAIAKDLISPNGASPLHVAIIFGNTNIVRYLAGRFPETLQVVDANGRTPLHYAATLADNGHYYSLLVHLGAEIRAEDKFGYTADYYRTHHDEMSHQSLLTEFGEADNKAEELFNDQDNIVAQNQVDMPFFATEEGRYLASSLGDPLIKGLTEVANKRPTDPIAYLAAYLYNFADNHLRARPKTGEKKHITSNISTESTVPASIEVVTVEPNENDAEDDSAFNSTSRDEHGQSMIHFAAARAHGRNALFQLLVETEINVAYRDELYRTARDISLQANLPENTSEIDRYVMHIATNGDTDKLVELLVDGYDHITDVVDENNTPIIDAVTATNRTETVSFLQSIIVFEEKRERVHYVIRNGRMGDLHELLADEKETGSGKLLAIGKNSFGRCSLHIAVLCQQEEIVDYLANTFLDTLQIGDNLERTALHYAMGVDKIESISKLLIKAGAKRVVKDLKGRQPTYYFLNKADIVKLQKEEKTL